MQVTTSQNQLSVPPHLNRPVPVTLNSNNVQVVIRVRPLTDSYQQGIGKQRFS